MKQMQRIKLKWSFTALNLDNRITKQCVTHLNEGWMVTSRNARLVEHRGKPHN